MDSLRGLAIGLMLVDHSAGILFGLTIRDSPVRWVTRLAMPLFCVLMGYFLREDRRNDWKRPAQILAACVAVNCLFYPLYGSVEILGSLLLTYLVFVISGRCFPFCVLAIAFYPIDPLRAWLDYPPTIVLSFVAQGALLRRFGMTAAGLSGVWLAFAAVWIDRLEPNGVNQRLCLFILPATLLVFFGSQFPAKRLPGFDWLGRHPLEVYVGQYYAIFILFWVLEALREAGFEF
ncbi:MAG: hypothetical protein ACPGLY_18110 [Rubripirellula sp.]